ncbi:MAG: Maf family protein [Halanaerobiaceae bacterium]
MTSKLVLASASPRRQELMDMLGLNFTVVPGNIDEENYSGIEPIEMVQELSKAKVEKVADLVEDTLVIGSDTIVLLGRDILGKPANQSDAVKMLSKIQNRKHTVITGIAVFDTLSGKIVIDYDKTDVYMRVMSRDEIENYVATGEPMDKAGSYGIQGLGGIFVEKINGSFYTVMGLPIHKLVSMLKEFNISIF